MKQILSTLSLLILTFFVNAQSNWKWTELAPIPTATANNAVCQAIINDKKYVYSFGGIENPLLPYSIHQRVFKYDVSEDTWSESINIPDTLGKIGNAASFVNNKIYLIGGRYIKTDGSEIVSNKLHVYNPFNDNFEVDASPLPIPVYGQVQSVWNDSLIFVISGANNSGSVPNVQIYNPYFDSWSNGTPLPNAIKYNCVGASGYILKNTIYYFGGAYQGLDTTASHSFRKGVINPNNPTQITWTTINLNEGSSIYRGACSGHNNTVFWIGGSKELYNYNAMEYQTSNVVYPNSRIMEYNKKEESYSNFINSPYGIMDLKGIAKLGGGNWVITGGIDSLQHASNRTFLLHNSTLSDIKKATHPPYFNVIDKDNYFIIETKNIGEIVIYDMAGRILYQSSKSLANLYIPRNQLSVGILLFTYNDNINLPVFVKKVNPH